MTEQERFISLVNKANKDLASAIKTTCQLSVTDPEVQALAVTYARAAHSLFCWYFGISAKDRTSPEVIQAMQPFFEQQFDGLFQKALKEEDDEFLEYAGQVMKAWYNLQYCVDKKTFTQQVLEAV